MKKLILLSIVALFIFLSLSIGVTPRTPAEISISTSVATLIVGITKSRNYLLIINSGSYEVRVTTYPNTDVTVGIPIPASYGYWENNYYVDISSYYAITNGVAASKISYLEK
jgi:hypothetical protein